MANVDRVNGFSPVGTLGGGPYHGNTLKCYKAAGTTVTNDLGAGDPVVLSGSGDADGVPSVTKATFASGSPCFGVCTGAVNDPDHKDRMSWIDGADTGYIMVDTSPDTIYEVQADAAMAVTLIGQNAIPIQTSALNRAAGTSGVELDAPPANGTDDMFKIIGFVVRADNTPNAVNNKLLVCMNNPQRIKDNAGV